MTWDQNNHWPYLLVLQRLSLALAVGLFVGIERERRSKFAGLRTFGFTALLGALGGILGEHYGLLSLTLLAVPVIFLNLQALRLNQNAELTTSVALFVTGFVGILCGQGHTLTPAAIGVTTAALLAWKQPLSGFSIKLSEAELRSAILLGILAFVIYPALPEGAVDPWGALEPRAAWLTIILIAGIGFVNYILWKIYGDRGLEMTGFLGGLVNSTVTTRELAQRNREAGGEMSEHAYRGILLATSAMVVRNGVLIAILAPDALRQSALAFAFMLTACAGLVFIRSKSLTLASAPSDAPVLNLKSPFSLTSALRFGFLLVVIQVAGVWGQRTFGHFGVYIASLLGGLFSSASAVAAAATLAAHATIPSRVAGISAVIASLTSALINLPMVGGAENRRLIGRLAVAMGIVAAAGALGAFVQASVPMFSFQ